MLEAEKALLDWGMGTMTLSSVELQRAVGEVLVGLDTERGEADMLQMSWRNANAKLQSRLDKIVKILEGPHKYDSKNLDGMLDIVYKAVGEVLTIARPPEVQNEN